MPDLSEKARKGLSVIEEMHGTKAARAMEDLARQDKFGAPLSQLALEYAFADAWGRDGLSYREKSLLVIAALIATRQSEELGNHVRLGLANGLSVADFESIVVQLAPYLGFPLLAHAQRIIRDSLVLARAIDSSA